MQRWNRERHIAVKVLVEPAANSGQTKLRLYAPPMYLHIINFMFPFPSVVFLPLSASLCRYLLLCASNVQLLIVPTCPVRTDLPSAWLTLFDNFPLSVFTQHSDLTHLCSFLLQFVSRLQPESEPKPKYEPGREPN